MQKIEDIENRSGFSIKSIGDIYGEPTTTIKKHTTRLRHNYLMWIGIDAKNAIFVRKYYLQDPASLDDGELALAKMGANADISTWRSPPTQNELNSVNFAGSGRFSIILGIPGWEFYNYPQPGHEPVVFHRQKTFFEDTAGGPVKVPVDGSYNRSFFNGVTDNIDINGQNYAVFRCDNLVRDESGNDLAREETLPLLFDINVKVPIDASGKYALVVIDPVGGNLGPPDQP
jgi:hypothetical protein